MVGLFSSIRLRYSWERELQREARELQTEDSFPGGGFRASCVLQMGEGRGEKGGRDVYCFGMYAAVMKIYIECLHVIILLIGVKMSFKPIWP